jgi:tRNA dimethylallyltransferase
VLAASDEQLAAMGARAAENAQRFDAMLEAGLVDEVRRLRARGDLHPDLPSMRCVGYRQVREALDAVEPSGHGRKTLPLEADPAALRALREAGTAATRQLAKRQLTWLRGMADRFTVEADAPDATARVIRRVMELTE